MRPASQVVLRIFIAEENELVRRGIRALLEDRPGWAIIGESATLSATIEQAKRLRPDVLLLDVAMPEVEAAISQLSDIFPTIGIVALAAQNSGRLVAQALAAGADGVVLKSEAASEVIHTVEQVGDGRSFLSPAAVTLVGHRLATQSAGSISADLTRREAEILEALGTGSSNKEVAGALGISVKTVNAHRSNIMEKLKLRNYRSLVHFAVRQGVAAIGHASS